MEFKGIINVQSACSITHGHDPNFRFKAPKSGHTMIMHNSDVLLSKIWNLLPYLLSFFHFSCYFSYLILLLLLFPPYYLLLRLLFPFFVLKAKRDRINAITLSSRCRPVFKNMPEMTPAART